MTKSYTELYPSAKLQAKNVKQADEIRRLHREVAALKDDLADIKAQRDEMREALDGLIGPHWREAWSG